MAFEVGNNPQFAGAMKAGKGGKGDAAKKFGEGRHKRAMARNHARVRGLFQDPGMQQQQMGQSQRRNMSTDYSGDDAPQSSSGQERKRPNAVIFDDEG